MDAKTPIDSPGTLQGKAEPVAVRPAELLDYFRLRPDATAEQAAAALGTTLAVVAGMLADPLFEAEYLRLRGYAYQHCESRCREIAPKAIDALDHILTNPFSKNTDKINAAKAIGSLSEKYFKIVVLYPQLAALKAEVSLALNTTNRLRDHGPETRTMSDADVSPPPVMPTDPPTEYDPAVLMRLKDILSKFGG